MLIECPSCARSYTIRSSALGYEGRSVVCAACQTRWFVEADEPVDADEPADRASGADRLPSRDRDRHVDRRLTMLRLTPLHDGHGRPDPARRPNAFIAAGLSAACLIGAMVLIGERTAIVRIVPHLAALYAGVGLPVNVRGLEFKDVKTVRADEGGQTSIAISGNIHNVAQTRTVVPHITFDIRNAAGTTIASWTEGAPKRTLVGAESISFTTHTPSLPADSKDVVVRFASDRETRDADTRPIERR